MTTLTPAASAMRRTRYGLAACPRFVRSTTVRPPAAVNASSSSTASDLVVEQHVQVLEDRVEVDLQVLVHQGEAELVRRDRPVTVITCIAAPRSGFNGVANRLPGTDTRMPSANRSHASGCHRSTSSACREARLRLPPPYRSQHFAPGAHLAWIKCR